MLARKTAQRKVVPGKAHSKHPPNGARRTESKSQRDPIGTILIAVIVGIPLALETHIFLGYVTTPKLIVAWVGSAGLLFFAGRWWAGLRALAQTRSGLVYLAFLLAQIVSVFLSTCLSADWHLSLFGTTARRLGALNQADIVVLAAVAASYVILKRTFMGQAFLAIEVTGGIAGIYGLLQYFGFDPFLPSESYNSMATSDAMRVPATFGHAMIFANFLLPVVLISGSSLLSELRRGWRLFHGTILVLTMAAIILTGTRSALMGLVPGIIIVTYFYQRHVTTRRLVVAASCSAVALVCLVTAFAVSPAGRNLRVRIAQWGQDSKGGPRLLVWRDSIPLFLDHWALGIGPEQFAGEFRKVQSLQLARDYPDFYHEAPHNLLLEVGVSQGIIGELILAGLLALGIVCGVKKARDGDIPARALLASLGALIVSLEFPPLAFTNLFYLFLIVGMLVGLNVSLNAAPVSAVVSKTSRAIWIVSGVLALLVAAVYVEQDLYFAATARGLVQRDLEAARKAYSIARRFPFPGHSLWCSRRLAVIARSLHGRQRELAFNDAKQASADAERNNEDRFDAYYQSAVLAVLSKDYKQGESKLQESINAAPMWYRPRATLANLLWASGRNQEAEQEAKLALQLAGVHEQEVKSSLERGRAYGQTRSGAQ